MRRTTAAAIGTVTGAALILGVRLSAASTPLAAPPPAFDLSEGEAAAGSRTGQASRGEGREKPDDRNAEDRNAEERDADREESADRDEPADRDRQEASGLQDGQFTGRPVNNPYGTVQVAVRIRDGRVTSAAATYPTAGQSETINADAIPKLKQQTLDAQSAEIDAVSGATYTSEAYIESLQAALDAAAG